MNKEAESTGDALEKIFHEPNRLAIMSTICAASKSMSFNEVKDACALTSGNLNRHLKVLKDAGVIGIKKSFVDDKPRTTISLSETGLDRFSEYLKALSDVLVEAKNALPEDDQKKFPALGKAIKI